MNEAHSIASRLIEVFNAAQELPPGEERRRFLDDACGDDTALRAEVEQLLEADASGAGFLKMDTAAPPAGEATAVHIPSEQPGASIGPYKLLEKIGEGGFGTVWVAEQQRPLRRKVALKVLKPGMDSRQVLARFEAERQALAIMDHPNIATVHDGGVSAAGRPFFVMELVKGLPVTEFCDQQQLTPRARLELFLQVCQAVQHAHQKGIIHRDLKPSNILVAMHDTKPVVKVIDFGIAKAMGQELTDKTLYTGFVQMMGTPLYMSPEQAGQSSLDVDTRSDIYSLGVLLYELLTGTTPFDKERFRKAAHDEIRRIIREEEPPKPSTKLSASKDSLPSVSAQRHMEPEKLTRVVRGELDWIVMKALEKDRSRRYETANGFALDVQRYLANEPVTACPPSTAYRLRKFVRRNRTAVAGASLMLLVLILAGGGCGWVASDRKARHARAAGQIEIVLGEAHQLMREERWPEALAAARRAGAVVDGGEADAASAQRVRERLRELEFIERLDQIRMEREFLSGGDIDRARAERDFTAAFRDFGVDVASLPVEPTVSLLLAGGVSPAPVAAALDSWAENRFAANNSDVAGCGQLIAVARGIDHDPTRDRLRATWGRPDAEVQAELVRLAGEIDVQAQRPATLNSLAIKLKRSGSPDAALRLLRAAHSANPGDFWLNHFLGLLLLNNKETAEAIRFYTAALAARPNAALVHNNLGTLLNEQHRLDEAAAHYRRAIALTPDDALPWSNLGAVLSTQKKLDEAVTVLRRAVELDPGHGGAYDNLGVALAGQGKVEEAIAAYRKAIELNPKSDGAYHNLGNLLRTQNRQDEAFASLNKAIELDPDEAIHFIDLAAVLVAQKKFDEAVTACRRALELDPGHGGAYINLGVALDRQGKTEDAVAAYRKAIELDPKSDNAYRNLGYTLSAQGKVAEALAAYLKGAEIAPNNAIIQSYLGGLLCDHARDPAGAEICFRKVIALTPNDAGAHYNLGNALKALDKRDEAIDSYRRAIVMDPGLHGAHVNLGSVLQGKKQFVEAEAVLRKAAALDPGKASAFASLGSVLLDQKKPEEAVTVLRRLVEIEPDNANAYNYLGIALKGLKKMDEATACHRKAIELDPDSVNAHISLGHVLSEQKQLDTAVAAYRKAASLDPKRPEVYDALGWVLRDQGKLNEAIEAFSEAVKLDATRLNAWKERADAFARLGQWAKAAADYEQTLKMDPESHSMWHRAAYTHLAAGDVAGYRTVCQAMIVRFGETDDPIIAERTAKVCAIAPGAVTDFSIVERLAMRATTGTEKHKAYAHFALARGITEYRAGRHAEAVNWLRQWPAGKHGHPFDATTFAAEAMVRHRLKQPEKAQELLGRAKAILEEHLPNPSSGRPFGSDWREWLEAQTLTREAEKLIAT